jgi:gamma-glutamyltranspeptidase/glutathione hydrolase
MKEGQVRPRAAVAAPDPAAAAAARTILLDGGYAVDAAVAAMLVCCVSMPGSVGLGGYGGSLVAYLAESGTTIALDFDSRAPLAYREEAFAGPAAAHETGYLSVTVPAVVAGLELTRERFGTRSWEAVSTPALELAENGVPISAELSRELGNWAKKAEPMSLRALLPSGSVPEAGTLWPQPDLARLLRRLIEGGPGLFYHGDIPRTIVRQVRAHGGILAEEDFTAYQAQVVAPLEIDYRGCRVLTPPPPSGGLTSLQILKTLEAFDLARRQPWDAEYFHLLAEASKQAWRDRDQYLGDPERTSIPVGRLLARETAQAAEERIRSGGTLQPGATAAPSPSHTVNVLTADSAGNVVSMTATHGSLYGSAVVIDGLGLVMGHGMSRFDWIAGSPNAPAPGKRMIHNMAPTLVLGRSGRPRAAVGMPGGRKIVTVTTQLVVNLLDFHASPAEAVGAGRLHVEADEPLAVSSAVPDPVIDALRALGHTVQRGQGTGGPPLEIGGVANALAIDPDTGDVTVASQGPSGSALVFDQ